MTSHPVDLPGHPPIFPVFVGHRQTQIPHSRKVTQGNFHTAIFSLSLSFSEQPCHRNLFCDQNVAGTSTGLDFIPQPGFRIWLGGENERAVLVFSPASPVELLRSDCGCTGQPPALSLCGSEQGILTKKALLSQQNLY